MYLDRKTTYPEIRHNAKLPARFLLILLFFHYFCIVLLMKKDK